MPLGDPNTPLDLKDPAALVANGAKKAAPRGRSPGSVLDGMAQAWEQFQDPSMREIAKTMFEVEVSKALGLPGKINLPDSQDMEMQQLVQQNEANRLRKEILTDTIETAKAGIIDLPDNDPDVQRLGLVGVDRDTLLESNPDAWLALAHAKNVPISRGDLSRYGGVKDTNTASAGPAFEQKQAEEQAKGLATQAGAIQNAGDIAKAEASGQYKDMAKAAIEAAGKTLDVNMGNAIDNPIDTDKGGLAFADGADTLLSGAGPAFKGLVAHGLIQAYGDDIRDALEDEPDKGGKLVVGRESTDISARATFFVASTVAKISKATGTPLGDVFKSMGLKFTGIDGDSWNTYAQQELANLPPESRSGFLEYVRSVDVNG